MSTAVPAPPATRPGGPFRDLQVAQQPFVGVGVLCLLVGELRADVQQATALTAQLILHSGRTTMSAGAEEIGSSSAEIARSTASAAEIARSTASAAEVAGRAVHISGEAGQILRQPGTSSAEIVSVAHHLRDSLSMSRT